MLRFIFSTGSLFTYGIDRCFALARNAGFEGIEMMVDARWDTRQAPYLNQLIDRYNLPIVAVHVPFETRSVPGWPGDLPRRVRETVTLGEAVGAEIVVHHLPATVPVQWALVLLGRHRFPPPLRNPYAEWLADGYAALQASTRLALCIENLPAVAVGPLRLNPGYWNTVEAITRFSNLTMDTTHLGTWGLDPVKVYDRLSPRVRHIHLSNFDGKEHRRPEAGRLRLDLLLRHLTDVGYRGAVSVELAPEALSAGQPDDVVEGLLAQSLVFCRQAAGRR